MVDVLIDAENIVGELLKSTNGSTSIFDLMTKKGNRIAFTEQALEELKKGSHENFVKLRGWMDANPNKVIRLRDDLTIKDYERYARALDDASTKTGSNQTRKVQAEIDLY